jgi:hypothetical protein
MRALILLALLASPATAASEAEWEQFRLDVEAACRALVTEEGVVTVEVDPFGSEHFGTALVTVTGEAVNRYICIYDKVTGTAELSSGLAPVVTPVAN